MSKSSAPLLSETAHSIEQEMELILQEMLDADEEISARGVVRRHSQIKAASSITRSPERQNILARYQAKQEEFRIWRQRLARKGRDASAMTLADKDLRIAELERKVNLLTYSHVAMLRAVGELGGLAKWSQFFENFQHIRQELNVLGAVPTSQHEAALLRRE
jgi:hypothetical protein